MEVTSRRGRTVADLEPLVRVKSNNFFTVFLLQAAT
jgi:hypothetical protein